MAIKKIYEEVVKLLEANPDKKIKDILDEVISLCEAKRARGGITYIKDTKGTVVAILDYYYKRWMPTVGPKSVEFGVKESSSTGLNPSCKDGASLWTKQNRQMNNELKGILGLVKAKKLKIEDIDKEEARIKKKYTVIAETELGFETRDEVVKYLGKIHKVKLEVKEN